MIPRPGLRMKTLKSGSWAMTSRPHSPLRQSTNTIVGSCWHSVYTNILCLAVSGMLSWEGLHITSSLQILPLLSTNIVPWRQRYIERNLHVYKAWHYFVKMLSGVCTLNMLKGRVEINRTEQNKTMLMQRYVYSLLRCASKHYWQSQGSSNIISLFIELFYVHRHTTFSY